MALFTDIDAQVAALRDLFDGDVTSEELPTRMSAFGATKLVETVSAVSSLVRSVERIGIVAAGITATRSSQESGQDGLAQGLGHRTPAALLQDLTGVSSAEAQRQVRLGLSVLETGGVPTHAETEHDPSGVEKTNPAGLPSTTSTTRTRPVAPLRSS